MPRKSPCPIPVPADFEVSCEDVRSLFERITVGQAGKAKVPNTAMCAEVADALGTIGRMLGSSIWAGSRGKKTVDQLNAFWSAADALELAIQGLPTLYGKVQAFPRREGAAIDGQAAFARLSMALDTVALFVPRPAKHVPGFDLSDLVWRLRSLFLHSQRKPVDDTTFGDAEDGPKMKFVKETLLLVAGIDMNTGAIRKHVKP